MMRRSSLLTVIATWLLTLQARAFLVSPDSGSKSSLTHVARTDIPFDTEHSFNSEKRNEEKGSASSRRSFLTSIPTLVLPFVIAHSSLADEGPIDKVLVLGGSGFVGSQVVEILRGIGIDTVATSRYGRDGTVALDFTQPNVDKKVEQLAAGCTAVISCVGAIATKNDLAVNSGTGVAAQAAKAAGVKRFVYITVAPEVKEFARDIDFLKDYMAGKTFSRDAVLAVFGQDAVLIEPTFIYGGGAFELNPPRVAKNYGKFIESILTASPIRNIERALSPGFIKIAFEPPIPVEDVANAAVAGALGKTQHILDSYDKIKQASSLLS
jgi:uncharacterized protein YbjT (DUF2867 family)